MSRWTRFIPVLAVGFVVTACGVDPVGTDPIMSDAPAPRMDGLYGTGANATGGGPGETTTSSTGTTEGSMTIPADSTSDGRYGTGGN